MKRIIALFIIAMITISGCISIPRTGTCSDCIPPQTLETFLPSAAENYVMIEGYPEGYMANWGSVAQVEFRRIKNVQSLRDYDGDVMVSIDDYRSVKNGLSYFKDVIPITAEKKTFLFKDNIARDVYKMRRSGGYEYVAKVTDRVYIDIVIYTPLAPGDNEDDIAQSFFKQIAYESLKDLALSTHNDE